MPKKESDQAFELQRAIKELSVLNDISNAINISMSEISKRFDFKNSSFTETELNDFTFSINEYMAGVNKP